MNRRRFVQLSLALIGAPAPLALAAPLERKYACSIQGSAVVLAAKPEGSPRRMGAATLQQAVNIARAKGLALRLEPGDYTASNLSIASPFAMIGAPGAVTVLISAAGQLDIRHAAAECASGELSITDVNFVQAQAGTA
jgi:FtsP/CotA-like multicopper oxidase with cupredoxin domain